MRQRLIVFILLICFIWINADRLVAQEYPVRTNAYIKRKLLESKPDTGRVKLLLALSRDFLFHSGAGKTDIDSALLLMRQALRLGNELKSPRSQGRALLVSALLMNRIGKPQIGLKNARDALSIFSKIKDPGNQADSYIIIGQHYGSDGPDLDKKISYYQKAAAIFLKIGMKERAASAFRDIGDFKTNFKSPADAIADLQQSLSIYNSINYKELQGVYDLIGVNYFNLGDYTTALKFGLLAVKAATEVGDNSLQLCTIYNRLALTYFSAKSYKDAIVYYKKALELGEKYHDSSSIQLIQISMSAVYYTMNELPSSLRLLQKLEKYGNVKDPELLVQIDCTYLMVYSKLKRFAEAGEYVKKLSADEPELNTGSMMRERVYRGIIYYYIHTNQFEKLNPYIVKHEKFCRAIYLNYLIGDDELWKFKADSALKKFDSAMKHYQRYKAVNDSLFDEKKTRQVAQLQVKYETDRKDRDIQLKARDIQLLTRRGQLQKTRSRQEEVLRNVFLVGTILMASLVVVTYNRYRLKQRNNLLLQTQQSEINEQNRELVQLNSKQTKLIKEKEWLLKEIHHRVKNNLQVTMSLLNIQSSVMVNSDALEAIRNSQRRMQAMSLIHQKLYQSENLALIDMSVYIPELVTYLKESFDEGNNLQFELLTQPVGLDIAQAVPLGLILNEAITNAIKYAFPDGRRGKITISIKKDPDSVFKMMVKDNGIGLPSNFDHAIHSSLGMNLMRGLADQLQGDFEIINENGTTIIVLFAAVNLMEKDLLSIDEKAFI